MRRRVAGGLLLALMFLVPFEAFGQRPFSSNAPFYKGETAKRSFYDGYALTAELAYRLANTIAGSGYSGEGPIGANALALSFVVDYELSQNFDLIAVMDASEGVDGRSVKVSWIAFKHYWYSDGIDYALRLALDPISEGGLGFRQTDLAFLSSKTISPVVSTNFAIGWRRVRVGLEQIYPEQIMEVRKMASEFPGANLVYMRAVGQEAHLMMSYNFMIDPAESHVFVSLLGEVGEYDVMEAPVASLRNGISEQNAERFGGGIIWLWAGFQWNRPSYQVAPYLSLPLTRWGEGLGKKHVGLRVTVR